MSCGKSAGRVATVNNKLVHRCAPSEAGGVERIIRRLLELRPDRPTAGDEDGDGHQGKIVYWSAGHGWSPSTGSSDACFTPDREPATRKVVGRREEQVSPDVERDGRLRAVTPA